jgi:hypothetical protein
MWFCVEMEMEMEMEMEARLNGIRRLGCVLGTFLSSRSQPRGDSLGDKSWKGKGDEGKGGSETY